MFNALLTPTHAGRNGRVTDKSMGGPRINNVSLLVLPAPAMQGEAWTFVFLRRSPKGLPVPETQGWKVSESAQLVLVNLRTSDFSGWSDTFLSYKELFGCIE